MQERILLNTLCSSHRLKEFRCPGATCQVETDKWPALSPGGRGRCYYRSGLMRSGDQTIVCDSRVAQLCHVLNYNTPASASIYSFMLKHISYYCRIAKRKKAVVHFHLRDRNPHSLKTVTSLTLNCPHLMFTNN